MVRAAVTPIVDIETLTGARVRLFGGEGWPGLNAEVGGRGVMLMIDMMQPGDSRHAEIFLDADAARAVCEGLGAG